MKASIIAGPMPSVALLILGLKTMGDLRIQPRPFISFYLESFEIINMR